MNLNLRCPKILQMTKITSIINKNYQDSCTQSKQVPNYDCRKTKFDSRYCGELVGEICNFFFSYVPFFPPLSRFMSI